MYLCNMDKHEHISFWIQSGRHSWDAADTLMVNAKYVESLFFFCLAIEKFLKANWVMDNTDNTPPRIHDLQSLFSQTDIELPVELIDFLDTVNRWNLEGRYPDYRFSLYKLATKDYIEKHIVSLKSLKACLLERF